MTCAVCSTTSEPETIVQGLTTCPTCLASVVAATGQRASGAQTVALTAADLALLKALRARLRKAKETD